MRAVQGFLPELMRPFRDVPVLPRVEAWRDGGWRHLGDLIVREVPSTLSFAPVTSDRFRVSIAPDPAAKAGNNIEAPAAGAETVDIFAFGKLTSVKFAELRFTAEPALAHSEAKAGFATAPDYHALGDAARGPAGFAPRDVIDLTDRVGPDGRLDWTPPAGRDWRILRFGWSLTGKTNHPASAEATGLEVDKFDPQAVERYLTTYLGMYRDAVGADLIGAAGIRALLTDSIEVGASNWTGRMEAEFAARRGYPLRPWLPALTGAVVGSRAESDRFMSDYRATLADMLSEHHYGTVARVARAQGLKVYGEALENGRPVLGDDLAMRAHADVPMAALWTWQRGEAPRGTLVGDMKGAASVAHVYGRTAVAAESMTAANAPWAFAPRDLKRFIDFEFAHGINLPVIHTSVHVPQEGKKPGLSLMIFGQYFNRNETWAEMARPWIDYIARSSLLLQQGRNVADVAVFHGEDAPLTVQFANGIPANLPRAHAYDLVNAAMLADAFRVEDGALVTTGGARYRALFLAGTSKVMTLATLRRVLTLLDQGATVVGEPPRASPSLGDDASAFDAAVARLRAHPNFVASGDIDGALHTLNHAPDFTFDAGGAGAEVLSVHRAIDDGHVYYVNKGEPGGRGYGVVPRCGAGPFAVGRADRDRDPAILSHRTGADDRPADAGAGGCEVRRVPRRRGRAGARRARAGDAGGGGGRGPVDRRVPGGQRRAAVDPARPAGRAQRAWRPGGPLLFGGRHLSHHRQPDPHTGRARAAVARPRHGRRRGGSDRQRTAGGDHLVRARPGGHHAGGARRGEQCRSARCEPVGQPADRRQATGCDEGDVHRGAHLSRRRRALAIGVDRTGHGAGKRLTRRRY